MSELTDDMPPPVDNTTNLQFFQESRWGVLVQYDGFMEGYTTQIADLTRRATLYSQIRDAMHPREILAVPHATEAVWTWRMTYYSTTPNKLETVSLVISLQTRCSFTETPKLGIELESPTSSYHTSNFHREY
ncbi:hypothetical protein N7447_009302 [Penicillium robsamsonii]|uniref:uncharacterized protein n=1 Tax=Penicillium robsamsonii TaxID=1792511 RepID=UPI0025479D36|nr:uncharacterized protein N7447_009302 [Penicillium robsamsonii]KAJ5817069.1 hypothetical protein N7447_009302 [Penicillium robsamsonii]